MNVYSNSIYNCQKLETAHVSCLSGYTCYIHVMEYYTAGKELLITSNNLDESQKPILEANFRRLYTT